MTNPAPRPRRLLGTSLKMYFDLPSTLSYTQRVASLSTLATENNIDLFLIPDFISLLPCHDILKSTPIRLGAQDTYHQPSGAFTGEVSPLNLSQAGVSIVEIGHAERRRLFGETDKDVSAKAGAVVAQGMTPLVCVGEKTHGRIASAAVGMAVEECRPQVKAVLDAVPADVEIALAYEPVWAIGAAEPAGADHVVAVAGELRRMCAGRKVRILYGGSAGPGTFEKLKEGVDGLFLGRFAHDIGNLEKVITEMGQP